MRGEVRIIAICLILMLSLTSMACKTRSSEADNQTNVVKETPAPVSSQVKTTKAEPKAETKTEAKTAPASVPKATVTESDMQVAANNLLAAVIAVFQGDTAIAHSYLLKNSSEIDAGIVGFAVTFNSALTAATGKEYVPFYVSIANSRIVDGNTIVFDINVQIEGDIVYYSGILMKRSSGTWKMPIESLMKALGEGGY